MLDEGDVQRGVEDETGFESTDERPVRSLTDDISALIDDGKTYAEAELAFQKSRLSFVAGKSKSGIGYSLAALGFLHLALIGLVVGGIFTLATLVGPGLATLIVFGVLLVFAVLAGFAAKARFEKIGTAFEDGR